MSLEMYIFLLGVISDYHVTFMKSQNIVFVDFFPENIVIHFGIMDLYQDAKMTCTYFSRQKHSNFNQVKSTIF